mmetsp:Transcript_11178/g.22884  ORF Transcript_11178/g.22884 Transcript_11178/m.22884 type:complete len:216 (-) Transcript_11178:528-1175(-)
MPFGTPKEMRRLVLIQYNRIFFIFSLCIKERWSVNSRCGIRILKEIPLVESPQGRSYGLQTIHSMSSSESNFTSSCNKLDLLHHFPLIVIQLRRLDWSFYIWPAKLQGSFVTQNAESIQLHHQRYATGSKDLGTSITTGGVQFVRRDLNTTTREKDQHLVTVGSGWRCLLLLFLLRHHFFLQISFQGGYQFLGQLLTPMFRRHGHATNFKLGHGR